MTQMSFVLPFCPFEGARSMQHESRFRGNICGSFWTALPVIENRFFDDCIGDPCYRTPALGRMPWRVFFFLASWIEEHRGRLCAFVTERNEETGCVNEPCDYHVR